MSNVEKWERVIRRCLEPLGFVCQFALLEAEVAVRLMVTRKVWVPGALMTAQELVVNTYKQGLEELRVMEDGDLRSNARGVAESMCLLALDDVLRRWPVEFPMADVPIEVFGEGL